MTDYDRGRRKPEQIEADGSLYDASFCDGSASCSGVVHWLVARQEVGYWLLGIYFCFFWHYLRDTRDISNDQKVWQWHLV